MISTESGSTWRRTNWRKRASQKPPGRAATTSRPRYALAKASTAATTSSADAGALAQKDEEMQDLRRSTVFFFVLPS